MRNKVITIKLESYADEEAIINLFSDLIEKNFRIDYDIRIEDIK
jgi:hypothetical protein